MKLLVVIDMQNDFIDGSLGTKEAVSIVSSVKKKIESYKNDNNPVVFTRDTHTENYLNTQEGRNLPVVHCVKGTGGWQISKELDSTQGKIFDKPSFGSTELAEYIAKMNDVEQIELVGLCTDICVISNALIIKAFCPETEIVVDASCCAGVTVQSHNNALEAMKMCQIKVINQ